MPLLSSKSSSGLISIDVFVSPIQSFQKTEKLYQGVTTNWSGSGSRADSAKGILGRFSVAVEMSGRSPQNARAERVRCIFSRGVSLTHLIGGSAFWVLISARASLMHVRKSPSSGWAGVDSVSLAVWARAQNATSNAPSPVTVSFVLICLIGARN